MELTKAALELRRQQLVGMIQQLEANIATGQDRALRGRGALEQVENDLATLALPEPEPDDTPEGAPEAEEEAAADQDEPTPS